MSTMSSQRFLADPKPAPDLNIPPSSATVTVRLIDSTTRLVVPMAAFLKPPIPGHDFLRGPTWSFLVEHSSGHKLIFDLGARKDPENLPPPILGLISQPGWEVHAHKNVADILEEHSVKVSEGAISAVVWSHWHYDHIGDPSTFPGSTALVVGPGFKQAFMPGYPSNEQGLVRDSDFEGREVREVDFEADRGAGVKIGGFKAVDYFGDGSYYLLDSPGHAVGHMCGLARVTTGKNGAADTFILMGGDACHHGGGYRPTEYLPLPKEIPAHSLKAFQWKLKGGCPGALFEKLHREKNPTAAFYQPADGFSHNLEDCEQTVHDLQEFDAADNVFVVIAHDAALLEPSAGVAFFPESLNGWKEKGLAEKVRWSFLSDFEPALEAVK